MDKREFLAFLAAEQATCAADRNTGSGGLARLLEIGRRHSGQSKTVATFLLGLYDGERFRFDLTDFRTLDREIFNDCIAVLRMDYLPAKEVHRYFDRGEEIFERMAQDHKIPGAIGASRPPPPQSR